MTHEELNQILDNAFSLRRKGDCDTAEQLCNEVFNHLPDKNDVDSIKILGRTFLTLGNIANQKGDNSFALEKFSKALENYESVADANGTASVMNSFGLAYAELSDYPHALEYFGKALALNEQLGNKAGVANHLSNIGGLYGLISDYSRALEYYSKALDETNDKEVIARVLCNIGVVYLDLADYPLALEFFGKALELSEQLGNKAGIAANTGNIGTVYVKLMDYPSSLEYFGKALELSEELDEKSGVAINTGNIGAVYFKLLDYVHALEYFGKALAIDEQLGNKWGIARHIENIGTLYANEKFDGYDHIKAEEYLYKAIAMFEELGLKKDLYLCHQELANLYEKQERWQEFAVHYKKYHELEKAVLSEEAKKSADRFEIQMLLKEKEIERLKNVELARANEELVKLNSEKNEFLGIAAHDLKNPLAAITTSIGILKRYGNRLTSDEILEKHTDIERTSQRMLAIITNLLDINAIERGAITFKSELFNLSETVSEVVDSNRQRAEEKSISIFFDLVPELTEITADKQITSQILDNLVSNAVKYSPQNKNVWVNVEPQEKSAKISVRDEGPGLSSEDMKKLFGRFQRLSAKPTGGEHSTGLGLSIVKKLVEAMNGKVWCESELGKGATFFVELPKIEH